MYKDIISYQLSEGTTPEQLYTIAQQVRDDWMSQLEGCIGREINTDKEGKFVDIVYWTSAQAAKKAEETMDQNTHAQAWYACYDMSSIQSQSVTAQKTFKPTCE